MNIYTPPNDTLNLEINLHREKKIRLEGVSEMIYHYYIEKHNNWKKTKGYDYVYDSTMTIFEFAEKVNNHRDNDLMFLSQYLTKNNLPDWFIDIERSSIIYLVASQKLGILNTHWILYDSTFNPPKNYYSFVDELEINNLKAGLSYYYYNFLMLYYGRSYKPSEPGFQSIYGRNRTIIEDYKSINDELDSRIMDIFLGKSLSILYKDKLLTQSNILHADSLFERARLLFQDESLLRIIDDYRNLQKTKFRVQVDLNPGVDAPGFYLSDSIGNYYRLSDFRGNVIFVNFWTTFCLPCIKSIPAKNNIVEEFKDHPFELVNICMDYRPEIWKRVIEKSCATNCL